MKCHFLQTPFVTLLERGMKGWIMGGIAREAPKSLSLQNRTVYLPTRYFHKFLFHPLYLRFIIGNNTNILFLHHRILLKYYEQVDLPRVRVFITHVDENEPLGPVELGILASVGRIIFQNSALLDWGVSRGIPRQSCLVAHGAISKDVFYPASDICSLGYVLITGDCKSRKRPELIREVINFCKDIQFIIHGNGWRSFFDGEEPFNLKILDFDLRNQPQLMREAHALLSLALNEGGPFPVLEALASGTPVLATDTGFCKEVIREGSGFVLDVSSSLVEIKVGIEKTMALKKKVYSRNLLPDGHSWEEFAERIYIK
jgi:glycosyltransferase involved in cell wall biosynthesis